MVMDWVARSASTAIGQRSLGDRSRLFPLYPPLLKGCPATSGAEMQYPLEIEFDYARVSRDLLRQPPLPGIERWAPLLPPLSPGLSLGEGGTPLIAAAGIADWVGIEGPLWLKDESRNPTWSHKDRLNLCTTSAALAVGASGIAVASSGNHGVAAAAYAARAGLRCVVVTSPDAQPAFRRFLAELGAAIVVVPVEERWPVLDRIVAATGFMPMSNLTRFHTGNPFGPEGYKTIAYEIFAQLDQRMPSTVVVPTGYGELLYGLWKGFREIVRLELAERPPRMIAAEPAVRGPLARALAGNVAAVGVHGGASLAAGIACTVGGVRGTRCDPRQRWHGAALRARRRWPRPRAASPAKACGRNIPASPGSPLVARGVVGGRGDPGTSGGCPDLERPQGIAGRCRRCPLCRRRVDRSLDRNARPRVIDGEHGERRFRRRLRGQSPAGCRAPGDRGGRGGWRRDAVVRLAPLSARADRGCRHVAGAGRDGPARRSAWR